MGKYLLVLESQCYTFADFLLGDVVLLASRAFSTSSSSARGYRFLRVGAELRRTWDSDGGNFSGSFA